MKIFCIAFIFLLLSAWTYAQKSDRSNSKKPEIIEVPLTPEAWDFAAGKVEFLEYKGQKAVRLNEKSGTMVYKHLNFINGTIEFDVEVSDPEPFPQLYFRWQNENECEHVYLRTGATNKKAFDAVQYASVIKGVNTWDLQHEYQSAANTKIGEWNHVKLVVSGKKLRVYINNVSQPNLDIPCMEGNTNEGRIALQSSFTGQSVFANLVIKPKETEGLTGEAGADITQHDTRYIRNWQVSPPDMFPAGSEVNANQIQKVQTTWEPILAERRGLVNLSRKFGRSDNRRVVLLKATIQSDKEQSQILKMGFSDEIWVFLNGRPVYVDKNIYVPAMRKSPNGRISLDNCAFPISLTKGNNELLIAVANDFYGWGIMARLETVEGLSF